MGALTFEIELEGLFVFLLAVAARSIAQLPLIVEVDVGNRRSGADGPYMGLDSGAGTDDWIAWLNLAA